MQISENIASSLQSIFSHKFRSFLTLLGIIIGVFAVVTMFSAVYGLKTILKSNMEGLGFNNSVMIYPSDGQNSRQQRRSKRFRFRYINRGAKPLTMEDFTLLQGEIDAKYAYGMVEGWHRYYVNEKENWLQLRATNNSFFETQTYKLKDGRLFNKFELNNATRVCVVGFNFANKYYPGSNAIGEDITVAGSRFKIIGVLGNDELNKSGMNFNSWQRQQDLRAVYIPLSTGARYFRTNNAIDYIYMQAYDEDSYLPMKTRITQTLLAAHSMAHDFSFNDVGAMIVTITKELTEKMKKWNITLFAIASISLIVGGIGLFSTLLISINERMAEIGIRKSIGATGADIFLLFLIESVTLALMGAFIGIFTSSLLVKFLGSLMKADLPVPIQGVLLGIGFSVLIGIISGLYPSIKASRIDPIKAIYYSE